jgi:hypothetical protein
MPITYSNHNLSKISNVKKYWINTPISKQLNVLFLSTLVLYLSPERKNTGGIFGLVGQTTFLEFKVQTIELNWKVGRRYSDFVWLRSYLLSAYPSYILPPIP